MPSPITTALLALGAILLALNPAVGCVVAAVGVVWEIVVAVVTTTSGDAPLG